MVLLGDEAQFEARFGPFGDSANLDARSVHGLRKRTIDSEIILDAPDGKLLGGLGHVESCSVHLEMVLVLVQDRCMVFSKCTIGSDIVQDTPDGTPW